MLRLGSGLRSGLSTDVSHITLLDIDAGRVVPNRALPILQHFLLSDEILSHLNQTH